MISEKIYLEDQMQQERVVCDKTRDILARENESLKQQIDERNALLASEQSLFEKELESAVERNA